MTTKSRSTGRAALIVAFVVAPAAFASQLPEDTPGVVVAWFALAAVVAAAYASRLQALANASSSLPTTTPTTIDRPFVEDDGSVTFADDEPARNKSRYLRIREGTIDPLFGRHVKDIVFRSAHAIVFLDAENYVYWEQHAEVLPPGATSVLNRAAILQALPLGSNDDEASAMLTSQQVRAFRLLIGEALARIVDTTAAADPQCQRAHEMCDQAEAYYRKRIGEAARVRSVVFTGIFSAIVVLSGIGLWLATKNGADLSWFGGRWLIRFVQLSAPSDATRNFFLAMAAGAAGAFFSVAVRATVETKLLANQTEATRQTIEAFARVATGMIGGAIAFLAIESRFVMGSVEDSYRFSTMLLFCTVAGLSERLVPSIVKNVEDSADSVGAPERPRPLPSPKPGEQQPQTALVAGANTQGG